MATNEVPQGSQSPTSPPPLTDLDPPFTADSATSRLAQPTSVSKLSLTDRLLLAQVVHSHNESPPDWPKVSNAMLNHPLVKSEDRVKAASDAGLTMGRVFGSRECERSWVQLMRQYHLTQAGEESEADVTSPLMKQRPKEARGLPPRTDRKSQLALAQILYAEKMEELRDSIKKKEEEFKILVRKIDDLKAAKDDQAVSPKGTSEPVAASQQQLETKETSEDSRAKTSQPLSIDTSMEDAEPSPSPATPRMSRARAMRGRAQPSTTASATRDQAKNESASDAAATTAEGASSESKGVITDDNGDAVGVEEVLGGETAAKDSAEADPLIESKEDGGQAETRRQSTPTAVVTTPSKTDSPQASPSASGKRNKRKREEQAEESREPSAVVDEQQTEAERPTLRESKRTRSSTITTPREDIDAEEQGAQAGRRGGAASRPTPLTRRSRRGIKEEEDAPGTNDEDTGDHVKLEPVSSPTTATALGSSSSSSSSSRPKAVRRRSARGRGSTQSREASAMREDEQSTDVADVTMESLADETAGEDSTMTTVPSHSRRSSGPAATRSSRRGSVASTTTAAPTAKEREQREKRGKANQKLLMQIWSQVSAHKNANIFQSEVRATDAPDYGSLILRPLSLKSIKAAIKDYRISTLTELRANLEQLFANAIMFNRKGGHNPVHGYAQDMRAETDRLLREYEQQANGKVVPGGLGLQRPTTAAAAAAAATSASSSSSTAAMVERASADEASEDKTTAKGGRATKSKG